MDILSLQLIVSRRQFDLLMEILDQHERETIKGDWPVEDQKAISDLIGQIYGSVRKITSVEIRNS